jgi:ribosomal protein S18 acetylase RimI-like enzyme
MRIEILKNKDIPQASKLARKIINQTLYYSKEARKEWSKYYSVKTLRGKLEAGIWFIFVAKDKNKIVGFSDVRIEGKVGRSEWSCINRKYRRMGIGTALFKRKIEFCSDSDTFMF